MRHTNDKDTNKLLKKAIKAGCRIETGGRHLKLYAPNGEWTAVATTSSDVNACHHIRRWLRRQGINV
jgi:hypothetical protein